MVLTTGSLLKNGINLLNLLIVPALFLILQKASPLFWNRQSSKKKKKTAVCENFESGGNFGDRGL